MDLRRIYKMWLKSTQALVVAGGLGLALSNGAVAQDCVPCESACGSDAVCNDQIFADAGAQLACDIDRLAASGSDCGDDSCFGGGGGGNWLDDSGIDIGGWVQYGYYSDSNRQGLDLNFNDNLTGFGSTQRGGLHQAWLYAERVADGSDGIDFGFRVDAMYGLDSDDTNSFGNDDPVWDAGSSFRNGIYGFALPQAYVEVAAGDLSVIAGHFYTLIGYEVVTAPDNFFFSHAYTMFNNEPFTHTGVLATYALSDDIEVYAGWTLGWDTGFDQNDNGSNFLGGASVALTEDVSLTYITTLGDFGSRGEGYSHSVVLDVALTDDLNYVFQTDLVETNLPGDHQVSVNQYLFYTINDYVQAGLRAEWWGAGSSVTGVRPNLPLQGAGQADIYEVTAGLNFRPLAGSETDYGLIIRPEVRHDWSRDAGVIGQGGDFDFTTFACDVIVTF